MNAMISLRKAGIGDKQMLQTLYVETIKNACRADYNSEQLSAWARGIENEQRWNSILAEQYFLIATIGLETVGFGSLENGDYIDFLYVHHAHLRKGIARIIYKALVEEAKRQGKNNLSSDVSKTARPFFEQQGFEVVRENINKIHGIEIINYHMTLGRIQ